MEILLMLLAGCIVCGLVGSAVASAKGAPTYKGFLWGFIVGPIGWIIAALVLTDSKKAEAEMAVKMEKARALARQQNAPKQQVSVADELAKLAALRDSGALTADEFDLQKRRLLSR